MEIMGGAKECLPDLEKNVRVRCEVAPAIGVAPRYRTVKTILDAQLRLSGVLDSLEQRNRQAIDGQLAYTEFLAMLLHDEVARCDQKKLCARPVRASLGLGKTLETFNFDRLPKLTYRSAKDGHRSIAQLTCSNGEIPPPCGVEACIHEGHLPSEKPKEGSCQPTPERELST